MEITLKTKIRDLKIKIILSKGQKCLECGNEVMPAYTGKKWLSVVRVGEGFEKHRFVCKIYAKV